MKPSFISNFKTSLSFLFILYFSFPAICQKHYYFDHTGIEISKKAFKKLDKKIKTHYSIYYEQNDSVIHRLVLPTGEGRLDKDEFNELRQHLAKSTSQIIQPGKVIAIKYFQGWDPCLNGALGFTDENIIMSKHDDLKKEIEEIGNTHLVCLYNKDTGLETQKLHIPWYQDIEGKIEKRFFQYHYPCGSFVVIGPAGKYHAVFGEYSDNHFIDVIRSFK